MKEKIIEIILSACALDECVTEDSELKLLSIDSLSYVGAIVEMEASFGIEFGVEELELFRPVTVGDIIKYAEVKVNEEK